MKEEYVCAAHWNKSKMVCLHPHSFELSVINFLRVQAEVQT